MRIWSAAVPTIAAIFAVDSAGGFLPDVLVYSSTEPAKVSKAPPSYGSYRVEFNEITRRHGVTLTSWAASRI